MLAPSPSICFVVTVLKSTGSSFNNFIRDEYTTLKDVDDRIFSTSVDLVYNFTPIPITPPSDKDKLDFALPVDGEKQGSVWDASLPERARTVTLEVFATDDSASVQVRLIPQSKLMSRS